MLSKANLLKYVILLWELTFMVKLYPVFRILLPVKMVPGLTEFNDFLTPLSGLQNGIL